MKNFKPYNILFILISFLLPTSFVTAQERSNMEISGDVIQLALPAIAFGSTFIYKSDDKPHWQFLKTYALATLITHGLKPLINESRPNGGQYSFPSGHTTSAFAGAAFLQMRYGWKIGIPAYLLAGYVGHTRVQADKHYIWDVAAGAAIGIGSALIFVKPYKNKNISWQIYQQQGYYNLRLVYRF